MRIIDFLIQLDKAIAISFYADHQLAIFNGEELIESPSRRPMGIAFTEGGMAVASKYGIDYYKKIHLAEDNQLFYRQTITKYMGRVDAHELVSSKNGLIFANTLFSCASVPEFSRDFAIAYKPSFINEPKPEDHSHLNGLAIVDGKLRFITCFLAEDNDGRKSWGNKPNQGCLWDIVTEQPVIENIALPHSPRFYDRSVYVCESGKGSVLVRTEDTLAIVGLNSFTRGLIVTDDYLLVGTSKIREAAKNKSLHREYLKTNKCGIHLIERRSLELVDSYYFENKREIFDIQLCERKTSIVTADSKIFNFLHFL